jgi:hypothetical protein
MLRYTSETAHRQTPQGETEKRPLVADNLRQALERTDVCSEPNVNFLDLEDGVSRAEAHVACTNHVDAAADTSAMDHGNDGLRGLFNGREACLIAGHEGLDGFGRARRVAFLELCKLPGKILEVDAAAKMLAAAREQDDATLTILSESVETLFDLAAP